MDRRSPSSEVRPVRIPPAPRPLAVIVGVAAFTTAFLASGGSTLFGERGPGGAPSPDAGGIERILLHDNVEPAGVLAGGVLELDLEVRTGLWYPEGPEGPGLPVHAFAEVGGPLLVPGPLVRVPVGTEVRVRIVNLLESDTVALHGLGEERGVGEEPDGRLAPGEAGSFAFRATTQGTHYYGGTTSEWPFLGRFELDSQLTGLLVVDPAGTPPDPDERFFLISWWFVEDEALKGPSGFDAGTMVLNGRSWPHTERFRATVGDTLRWRVVNVTDAPHPMHLHGFYFHVDGVGDGRADTVYTARERRMAVTETVWEGGTFRLHWVPERPGNWLFHCHFAFHISHELRLGDWWETRTRTSHDHGGPDGPEHHEMAGLVVGVEVAPRPGEPWDEAPPENPRRLSLGIHSMEARWGDAWGYAFSLGGGTPSIPGPPLVLERGVPVAITLVNRSREPAAVHWHGIELESFPDGVPGWSGRPGRILEPVPRGEELEVVFTPPRSGTFMYHSHFNEMAQLEGGLYGAIVVVDRLEDFDPATDHLWVIGIGGPGFDTAPLLLNGVEGGPPPPMTPGVPNRVRIVQITAEHGVRIRVRRGEETARWTPVARDGADLPPWQAVEGPAEVTLLPGEILDVLVTPDPLGREVLELELLPVERVTEVAIPLRR
jgi:manganese oxidase